MGQLLKDFMAKSFLAIVLRRDPRLGAFFIAFAGIQLLAQMLTAEVTPFFLYGMYSEPIHPSPEYVRVTCHVDGRALTQEQLPRYAGELFFSTLYRLEQLDTDGHQDLFRPFIEKRFGWLPMETRNALVKELSFDPGDTTALGDWMVRYLTRTTGMPVSDVRIDREIHRYVDQRPVLVERTTLLTARAHATVHP